MATAIEKKVVKEDENEGPTTLVIPGQTALSPSSAPIRMFYLGMGLDEEIYKEMNRDVPTIIPSLPEGEGGVPGLAATMGAASGLPVSFGDASRARQPLIKQPPPKKAQRQFERTWMGESGSGEFRYS